MDKEKIYSSVSVCVFRFGKNRKPAAAWEWGYLQISLWDYWSVLFRGWCKYLSSGSIYLGCFPSIPVTLTSVLYRLMKTPPWSRTHKAGPSTLIQLPTCRQRNLISRGLRRWVQAAARVLRYQPQTFIHLSSNLVPKDLLCFVSKGKLNTEGFTHSCNCTWGVFSFSFFFLA